MKKRRRNKHPFNSTLPIWIIERGATKGTLNMECPRCSGKLIVSRERLVNGEAKDFIGRPCPYCHFTNRLPERYMSEQLLITIGRREEE